MQKLAAVSLQLKRSFQPSCTTMPHPDTSTTYAETGASPNSSSSHLPSSSSLVPGLSCFPAPIQLPACTTMPQLDTSTPNTETGASPNSSSSHLSSSLVSCLPARILPASPNQPRLKKFPLRQFGTQRRGFSATWYDSYPWLRYLEDEDVILCFYCATAVERKMPMTG